MFEQPSHRTYDAVLVANMLDVEDDEDEAQKSQKRQAFLQQLKKKKIKVTHITQAGKEFYGLRAPDEIFEDYQYLLKVSDSCNWIGEVNGAINQANRPDALQRHLVSDNLEKLISEDVFETTFCLHEVSQHLTDCLPCRGRYELSWCIFICREYFGEKVALYYLWLGWYTKLLVPAAALGVVVFLYALAFFNTNPLIKEVCHSNITMCPRCDDDRCPVWQLSVTCTYAKVSHLFDNEGTVAFAMFMAIWATLFLEFWKRIRATHVSAWHVYDWCEEEVRLIPEDDLKCTPYRRLKCCVCLILVLQLIVIIGFTHALVVFRVVAAPLMSQSDWKLLKEHANIAAVLLGAVLHYITIQIMNRVQPLVFMTFVLLCSSEKLNSSAAKERSFTVKMFTFQFFTLFSSLFYVAFFLGRINGHPGQYVRIAGFRLEECDPSGCLTDLFIQMAVIMLLKQTLNNIVEFTGPWVKSLLSKKAEKRMKRKCGHCYRKACRVEPCDICKLQDWLRNYHLCRSDAFSLFEEFLEMVIQFSFTTIFVAAFPLAPLLALINNIFEIRLDAIKMTRLEQRLVPRKTNDIGVWTKVLEAVGVLAVITNGLVIGITSDFIPRLVYRYHYGPCAGGSTNTHCMEGYINDTLSTAYMINNDTKTFIHSKQRHLFNVTECSYRDYRNEDNELSHKFWLVLAARFAFVILFEHVVVVCKFIAAWFVHDNPIHVKNSRQTNKMSRLKKELRTPSSDQQ
uniref:Anoctamin n=1 Tax=Nothobranchius furzeri TaxID=105023 RepID=A0A8C6VV02_NOTFU